MIGPPDLTVCVPVFNGAAFVGETLESLRRQTYPRFRVLISVDRSDDVSLAVCRAWEAYEPFEVVSQPARLGWIENVNWLLRRVDTAFACIVPHDDLLAPDYLERLVARLHQEPRAVLAYGDIQAFGTLDLHLTEPSLTGELFERILDFLLNRTAAVQWRGVVRTDAMLRTPLHRPDGGGFAADLVWLLELAAHGEFVREPGAIYRKRYLAGSVSGGWMARPPAQAATDWIDHSVACLDIALAMHAWTVEQRQHLTAAVLARAVRFVNAPEHPAPSPPDLATLLLRLAHVSMRASGALPAGTSLPDEADVPPSFRVWLDAGIGRLLPPGSAG